MNLIDKINKLSQNEFIEIFGNIFEKTKWTAEKLYNRKPFVSLEDLSSKMIGIFNNTSEEVQLQILKSHPDLAVKVRVNSLTTNSRNEQFNAGLNKCTEEEFNEFMNLNRSYKQKYGFPFIIAVKGKNKIEILSEFKKRILNTTVIEFREAIKQVSKIANLRLNEINIK